MKQITFLLVFCLAFLTSKSQTTTSPQAQYSNRGMYMNWQNLQLNDDISAQNAVLDYALNNHITYLCIFGLKTREFGNSEDYPFFADGSIHSINDTRAQELSNFIVRAKTLYGIEEVGVNVGTQQGASDAV